MYPVPDGDTGTNMARTLDAVVEEMDAADPDDLAATCDAISHGSLMGARGNSGVILSQILRGFASTLKETSGRRARRVQGRSSPRRCRPQPPAPTRPCSSRSREPSSPSPARAPRRRKLAADAGGSLAEVVRAAREAGKQALDNTPEQLPVLKEAGVVDAGGAGFLLLLDSALHVVAGDALPEAGPEPDDELFGATFEAIAHRTLGDGAEASSTSASSDTR